MGKFEICKPDPKTVAIDARQLCKSFGNQLVLGGVTLTVRSGEAIALMGTNGAGKTTLLRCLASAIRPSSGEVLWFGYPAGKHCEARRAVGFVAHESLLYPNLTIHENLLFAARMCDVSDPRNRVGTLLAMIGLEPYSHQLTCRISRGMRQRVAIGRALVHEPRILLLDEPFCGLDQRWADWLSSLLRERRGQGCAICVTTHDEERACQVADRILWLRSGRLAELASSSVTRTRSVSEGIEVENQMCQKCGG